MRLAFVTSSYPRFAGDWAGVFVADEVRALASRGHAVEVIAPRAAGRSPALPPAPGLPVRRVGLGLAARIFYGAGAPENLAAKPWLALLVPQAVGRLAFHCRTPVRAADAVFSHWLLPCGAIAAGLGCAGGPPHIATVHSGDLALLERLPGRCALAAALLAGSHRIRFVAEHLRARFLDLLPRTRRQAASGRLAVLPIGLDLGPYRNLPPPPPAPGSAGPLRVLCVARLVPIKGVDRLVQAVAGLANVRVSLAGAGPELAALQRLAATARAPVDFLGAVPTDAVAGLLGQHDVVVVPSRRLASGRREGLPRIVLEALAAGRPVVTSSEVADALPFATSAVVAADTGEPEALRAALARLCTAPAERAARAGAARAAAAAFDLDRVAAELEQWARDACAGVRRGRLLPRLAV